MAALVVKKEERRKSRESKRRPGKLGSGPNENQAAGQGSHVTFLLFFSYFGAWGRMGQGLPFTSDPGWRFCEDHAWEGQQGGQRQGTCCSGGIDEQKPGQSALASLGRLGRRACWAPGEVPIHICCFLQEQRKPPGGAVALLRGEKREPVPHSCPVTPT